MTENSHYISQGSLKNRTERMRVYITKGFFFNYFLMLHGLGSSTMAVYITWGLELHPTWMEPSALPCSIRHSASNRLIQPQKTCQYTHASYVHGCLLCFRHHELRPLRPFSVCLVRDYDCGGCLIMLALTMKRRR